MRCRGETARCNILLYAYDSDSPHHAVCSLMARYRDQLRKTVAMPWQTLLASCASPQILEPYADRCLVRSLRNNHTWLERLM